MHSNHTALVVAGLVALAAVVAAVTAPAQPASSASDTQVECVQAAADLVANRVDAHDQGEFGADTILGFLDDKADNIDSSSDDMQVDLLKDYIDRNFEVSTETRDATAELVGRQIDAADKSEDCWLTAAHLVELFREEGDRIDDPSVDLTVEEVVYLLEVIAGRRTPTPTPTATPSPTSTPVEPCPSTDRVDTKKVRVEEAEVDDPESLDENGDGWICVHVGEDGGRGWTDNDESEDVVTPTVTTPLSPTTDEGTADDVVTPTTESPTTRSPTPPEEITTFTLPPVTTPPPPPTLTVTPSWNGIDFGDARDRPYPSLAANNGSSHTDLGRAWFGENVSGEPDSRQVNKDTFDDGLEGTDPVTLTVTNNDWDGPLYVNILIDRDNDGDWTDDDEWVVRNRQVDLDPDSSTEIEFDVSWTEGRWMRVTLTGTRIADYDGTGSFRIGETEDYSLVHQGRPGGGVAVPGFGPLIALIALAATAVLAIRRT